MTLVIDTLRALRDPDYRADVCDQLEGDISEMLFEAAADEIERLREVIGVLEILTATGDGLTPDECMTVHMLAGEGRAHESAAWRGDPKVVKHIHNLISEYAENLGGGGAGVTLDQRIANTREQIAGTGSVLLARLYRDRLAKLMERKANDL